jgi:AcrR family transcriptional regulator
VVADRISAHVEPAPPSDRGRATRDRLLDAAEQLFAERGFEGTSMRAVTQAAGASVSAANYHFGSKQALLHATLQRTIDPINRRRIERLSALEREARGAPLALEVILDAFLRPAFEARAESADAPARYRQVAARIFSDPPEIVAELRRELFESVMGRFIEALGRALPEQSPEQLQLSFHFMVGIFVHVIAGHLEMVRGLVGAGDLSDAVVLRRLISFAAAGLRAPTEGLGAVANAGEGS